MKSKQEVIQEAWGKYWDEVKDNVNGMDTSGGWADNDFIHYNEDLGCDSKDFEFDGTLYRPKSLKGIEDNNGWLRIESEADLPKKQGNYWVCINGEIQSVWFEPCQLYKDMWRNVTHYQPIIKPYAPIY